MPIEIKELHIRVAVEAEQGSRPKTSSGSASGDMTAVVAQCVEQVMQLLHDRAER